MLSCYTQEAEEAGTQLITTWNKYVKGLSQTAVMLFRIDYQCVYLLVARREKTETIVTDRELLCSICIVQKVHMGAKRKQAALPDTSHGNMETRDVN